ncbi:hypothetical protein JB92DRAFT_2687646 [Gautieria morchelliformis]|nr:hypothetical protein JB92DRAFT_2687646 [Gautieria morchelliformis]
MSATDDLPPFDPKPSFRMTQPPNPSWSIGDKVEDDAMGAAWMQGEQQGWTVVDASTQDPRKLYALMISAIVPRPIAFVSTLSETNVPNLAPFSWFNMVSPNPPTVLISCVNSPTRPRDSTVNIKATKEFTVNIISEPFMQHANFTSVDAPEGQSEWGGSGLRMAPSVSIKPARVRESAVSMECELSHVVELSPPGSTTVTQTVMMGLVKRIHVRNDVMTEKGNVDPALLRAVSRMGDISYARVGEGFRLPRPTWDNVGDVVTNLEQDE